MPFAAINSRIKTTVLSDYCIGQ